eukprot:CAMPEP_0206228578 /NCGR_PEP_ID=MMETSP0047_2-20121206/9244_1 /ASSEMBLY_ACC=CAM_ASM_000192 /TAXON_ID=195065 /ORGANISM="Chroomonas mesostigmatica_cf, Strain CCMP1168" /LENGTH=176 /DNA_ID=CAMNT_0053651831 /DNA_START=35 /DNA_END=565 /DNA_ORIENTATION=-
MVAACATKIAARCHRGVKPVGYEAAICKRIEGAALPSFWFMEDKAGTYTPIIERLSAPVEQKNQAAAAAPAKAPKNKGKQEAKQQQEAKKEAPKEATRPASPPSAVAASSQPSGANETSPKGASSWAKVAATNPSPLPSPALSPAAPKALALEVHHDHQKGNFILADYVSKATTAH